MKGPLWWRTLCVFKGEPISLIKRKSAWASLSFSEEEAICRNSMKNSPRKSTKSGGTTLYSGKCNMSALRTLYFMHINSLLHSQKGRGETTIKYNCPPGMLHIYFAERIMCLTLYPVLSLNNWDEEIFICGKDY